MRPSFGDSGSQVPTETQMLLLEAREESSAHGEVYSEPNGAGGKFYILMLPLLERQFMAYMQGTVVNELQMIVEKWLVFSTYMCM